VVVSASDSDNDDNNDGASKQLSPVFFADVSKKDKDNSDEKEAIFFADPSNNDKAGLEQMAADAIKSAEAQLEDNGTTEETAAAATATTTTTQAEEEAAKTAQEAADAARRLEEMAARAVAAAEEEETRKQAEEELLARKAKLAEENRIAEEERKAADKRLKAKLAEENRIAAEEREKQLEELRANVGEKAQESYDKYIKPLSEIKEGVSADNIKGAALAATALSLLASQGVIASGAVGLSAAYLSISKTFAGDAMRTVGGITWEATESATKLAEQLGVNAPKVMKIGDVLKFGEVNKTVVNKYSGAGRSMDMASTATATATATTDRIDEVELAYIEAEENETKSNNNFDEDLVRVLREAETVVGEADAAIAKSEAEQKEEAREKEEEEELVATETEEEVEAIAETEEEIEVEDVVAEAEAEVEDVVAEEKEAEDVVAEVEEVVPEPEEDKEEVKELVPEPEDEEEEIAEEEVEEVVAEASEEVEEVVPEPEEDKEEVKELVPEPEDEEMEIVEEDEVEEVAAKADDEDTFFDDDEFMAAVELAQEGIEGKIVGVDEIITDNFAKAEWDAAGELANELLAELDGTGEETTSSETDVEDEKEDDDDDDDEFDIGDLDMEALGKMAREAVEIFESDENIAYEAVLNQKREWADSMTQEDDNVVDFEDDDGYLLPTDGTESDSPPIAYTDLNDIPTGDDDFGLDGIDNVAEPVLADWSLYKVVDLKTELKSRGLKTTGKKADLVALLEQNDREKEDTPVVPDREIEDFDGDLDFEDIDMEELGRQARAAVEKFQTTGGDFDEEPTEEMLAQLESELEINGVFDAEPEEDTPVVDIDGDVDFSKMTVPQLKDECRRRGLKVGGKKADLTQRLQQDSFGLNQ